MQYRFSEFEFNSESLILSSQGKTLTIRHTEAKVLALLLENSATVLTKEDILTAVWQHKVVSEQVVFQNISNLRALFGNQSIKTFPKRGYQWQLPIKSNVSAAMQEQSSATPIKRPVNYPAIISYITLLAVITFFIHSSSNKSMTLQDKTATKINISYIPFSYPERQSKIFNKPIVLKSNDKFNFTKLSHLDRESFEHGIEIEYPKLEQQQRFVLLAKIRHFQQQIYLDFSLKGPHSDWQGQLHGTSQTDVVAQLQQHLQQPVIYELIDQYQPPELKLAKLYVAHQASPSDLIILRKLSIMYLKTGELDKAMLMSNKLLNLAHNQDSSLHAGRALLYQGKALTQKNLFKQSAIKLELALKQFERINDLEHQSQTWYNLGRLALQQGDYPTAKSSMLLAAQLAFNAQNKLAEIEALIELALIAHDFQNDTDKYYYLQQAELKMASYRLPRYHFAEIPYRYADFVSTSAELEYQLKQVLNLASQTPENRIAQSSRRQLIKLYIEQDRLTEAQVLINSASTDNENNSYLKTLMSQARQQHSEMINYARRTFEQAQLSGNRDLSLDVALLLCRHQVNFALYSQYIKEHASSSWRLNNQTQLQKLKL